jgi:hypothetical protein
MWKCLILTELRSPIHYFPMEHYLALFVAADIAGRSGFWQYETTLQWDEFLRIHNCIRRDYYAGSAA